MLRLGTGPCTRRLPGAMTSSLQKRRLCFEPSRCSSVASQPEAPKPSPTLPTCKIASPHWRRAISSFHYGVRKVKLDITCWRRSATSAGKRQRRCERPRWSGHAMLCTSGSWRPRHARGVENTGSMMEIWSLWGFVRDGRALIDGMLAEAEHQPDLEVPPDAWSCAARFAWIQNDYPRARDLYERAAEGWRK